MKTETLNINEQELNFDTFRQAYLRGSLKNKNQLIYWMTSMLTY